MKPSNGTISYCIIDGKNDLINTKDRRWIFGKMSPTLATDIVANSTGIKPDFSNVFVLVESS